MDPLAEPIDRDIFDALHKLRAKATRVAPTPAEVEAAAQAEWEAKNRARDAEWKRLVPDEYQGTNLQDPRMSRECVQAACRWVESSRRGLGFIGNSGLGKTRALTTALQRAHRGGRSVLWIRHIELARAATDAHKPDLDRREQHAASDVLRRALRVDVLLLDDLGKAVPTPRGAEALGAIVEGRTACGLPILWSAQGGGNWLVRQLGSGENGPDVGKAVVRRLSEFCECPDLPRGLQLVAA